jgi:UDP-N-acetylglucosamine 2-epimerase
MTLASPKIGIVMGTRPEAIKLAPVVKELRCRSNLGCLVISTGQHRTMLEQALAAFDLKPDIDLEVMTPGQTLHDVTSRTLDRMRAVLARENLSWVVVQGDTTTAFSAALAAFYAQVRVAHVEAGLRSGERYSPFPEELNRRLVDQLSEVLFAPTEDARRLLLAEGFDPRNVPVTGNTVVDALLAARETARRLDVQLPEVRSSEMTGRRMILVTAHRRESFGPGLESIFKALRRIVDAAPDVLIVYPVHLNPNVVGPARAILGNVDRVHLIRPLAYLEFVAAMERAHLVLTDSGGVQEEAPTFRKPILVMREVTERPEGIAAGVARLCGTSEAGIFEQTMALLDDEAAYQRMATGHNPYGDGKASSRIVQELEQRTLAPAQAAS